jgi:hypothetical protein
MSNAHPPKDFFLLNSVIGGHLTKDIFSPTMCFQKQNAHWSGSIQAPFSIFLSMGKINKKKIGAHLYTP